MTEKDVLMKFAAKSLGLTDAEVDALLYKKADDSDEMILIDGAADSLLQKNKDKIELIKKEKGESFDNGHKKGLGESLTSYETKLKEELGITSDKSGIDLIRHYGESQKESQSSDPTEEQVKKHPVFIKLEQDSKAATEEAVKTVQEEYNTFKGSVDREKSFAKINTKAMGVLTDMNPVIEGKPGENQKQSFFNALGRFNYNDNNGTTVITDPANNDSRVEDSQGNAKTFNQLVTEIAGDYFVFAEQGDQSSSGNNNDGGKWGKDGVIKITSEEDITALFKEAAGDGQKEAKISQAANAWRAKK